MATTNTFDFDNQNEESNQDFNIEAINLPPLPEGATIPVPETVETVEIAAEVAEVSATEPALVEGQVEPAVEVEKGLVLVSGNKDIALINDSDVLEVTDAEVIDPEDELDDIKLDEFGMQIFTDALAQKNKLNQDLEMENEALKARLSLQNNGSGQPSPTGQPQGVSIPVPNGSGNAVTALAQGATAVASGTVGLAAAGLKSVGQGIQSFLNQNKNTNTNANINIGNVENLDQIQIQEGGLPTHRIEQLEKHTQLYSDQLNNFWAIKEMQKVKERIVETAKELGMNTRDVIQRINKDDQFAELTKEFNGALKESPTAQSQKAEMDKTLAKWGKDYERTNRDLMTYLDVNDPSFLESKDKIQACSDAMQNNTDGVPREEGEDLSHREKLEKMMREIAEKIKEFVEKLVKIFKGNPDDNSPEP